MDATRGSGGTVRLVVYRPVGGFLQGGLWLHWN